MSVSSPRILSLAVLVTLLLHSLPPYPSFSQANPGVAEPYWVYLRPVETHRHAPLAVSERAIRRIGKMGESTGVDPRNLTVASEALAPLTERGINIRHVSRWLFAASAMITQDERRALEADPRIERLQPVHRFVRPVKPGTVNSFPLLAETQEPVTIHQVPAGGVRLRDASSPAASGSDQSDLDSAELTLADYGQSFDSIDPLGIPEMHRRGYSGAGILVALFDTGFRKAHRSLAGRTIVAEHDFVCGDDDVQWEIGDGCGYQSQDFHGTATWSVLGGFDPGHIVGVAFGASFVLARTEDLDTEVHLEEDNYIAALEWADSLGVDIISTSLGYRTFDDGSSYPVDDLDGETLPITRATEIAAERGMLVVTAMGNDGPAPSTLLAPADGKRVVSVGATDWSGTPMPFSSRGPTGDGRIKPDVSARGLLVSTADFLTTDGYSFQNGTSIATPLVGGLAALLLEARPAWTPDSIAAALRRSGDRANQPRTDIGWGVPDGLTALGDKSPRLWVVRAEWDTVQSAFAPPGEGQAGRILVWIRNDGLTKSSPGQIWIGPHTSRIALSDSSGAPVSALPPGQTDSVGFAVRLGEGPAGGIEKFYVHIRTPEASCDRKATLPIGPAYELSRFDAVLQPSGEVDVEWRLAVDEPYPDYPTSVRLIRIDQNGAKSLLYEEVHAGDGEWTDLPDGYRRFQYWLEVRTWGGLVFSSEGPREVWIAPSAIALARPYPNPVVKGPLTLPVIWPGGSVPEVNVFDVAGRRVAWFQGTSSNPGAYDLSWDLRDLSGKPVASGIYLLRLAEAVRTRVIVVR